MITPPVDRWSALERAPYAFPAPELAHAPRLRADIEARLRDVCAHLTADAFAALVDDIYATKLRWGLEQLETRLGGR
jgi:hypothetical protein